MFTNATMIALYAQARRDEDLRPRHVLTGGSFRLSFASLLQRFTARPTVTPAAPVLQGR